MKLFSGITKSTQMNDKIGKKAIDSKNTKSDMNLFKCKCIVI